ncbi:MAG TPA: PASTA domain-containing protein [Terracidiphilus sp.]|jgi:beta-lactam-binding protein with PASTA domain
MNGGFLIRFFRMASVVMVLIAAALLSAITTMHFAIHGAEVKVPTLKGMTAAEARSQAAGMGLNLDVDNRYYSADIAAGHILSQSPAPGTVVRREWHVRVAESLGPQKVDVPDTLGTDARVAALRLRRSGLEVGVTARLPFTGAEDGTVLAQDPPAHSQGIAQPSVSILVAAPGNSIPDGYVMPDLIGVPVITAQQILTRIGLKVDTPTYVEVSVPAVGNGPEPPKPPIVPGSVIAQQPMAGARVDETTTIKLTAAK